MCIFLSCICVSSMGLVRGTSGYNLMSLCLAGGSTVRLGFGGFLGFGLGIISDILGLALHTSDENSVILNCFSFLLYIHALTAISILDIVLA